MKSHLIAIGTMLLASPLACAQGSTTPYSTPGPQTSITSEQREIFTALEGIPADSEAWLALDMRNCLEIIDKIESPPSELKRILLLIDSVAIGLSEDTPDAITSANKLLYLANKEICADSMRNWGQAASPESAEILQELYYNYRHSTSSRQEGKKYAEVINAFINLKFPRAYMCITAKPGCGFILRSLADICIKNTLEDYENNATYFEHKGWKGVCFTTRGLSQEFCFETEDIGKAVALDSREYYIGYRMHNGKMLISSGPTPSSLTSVADGRPSVLVTDKVTSLQQLSKGKATTALYISPKSMNALMNSLKTPVVAIEDILVESFYTIGLRIPSMQKAMWQGINDTKALADEIKKIIPSHQTPLTATLSQDGHTTLHIECDACGVAFRPGKVTYSARPNTLIQAKGSMLTLGNAPDLEKIQLATSRLAEAFTITFSEREQLSFNGASTFVNLIPAAIELVRHDGCTTLNSLGDGWVVQCDFTPTAKEFSVRDKKLTVDFPLEAVSGNLSVKDADSLRESFSSLSHTFAGIMGILDAGTGKKIEKVLNYVRRPVENTCIYIHRKAPHAFPAFTLNDSLLTFCSDYTRIEETIQPSNTERSITGIELRVNLKSWKRDLELQAEAYTRIREMYKQSGDIPWSVEYDESRTLSNLRALNEILSILEFGEADITTSNNRLHINVQLVTP